MSLFNSNSKFLKEFSANVFWGKRIQLVSSIFVYVFRNKLWTSDISITYTWIQYFYVLLFLKSLTAVYKVDPKTLYFLTVLYTFYLLSATSLRINNFSKNVILCLGPLVSKYLKNLRVSYLMLEVEVSSTASVCSFSC